MTVKKHWIFLSLVVVGLFLLQMGACVHPPIDPNDIMLTDTMPMDTMPMDTMPTDTTIMDTISCDTAGVSYANFVRPFLDSHDCKACHRDGNAGGGIKLETYTQVKSAADNGSLVGTISHDGNYSPMPKNEPKLDSCEIAQVTAWVDAGAKEN